jgi:hypothetical protein
MQTGLNLFPVNGYHESLVVRFEFNKAGTDTFEIELLLYENGELISESYGIRSESTELFTSMDIPIDYFEPEIGNNPDSASIRVSIRNSDNLSLSRVRVEGLSFDGHYFEEDTIGYVPGPHGIEDGMMKAVVIYPNPTQDRIILKNAPVNSTIELWNLYGHLVSTKRSGSDIEVIEMNSLESGVYLLKVISGYHELTKKIVVQKTN